MQAHNAERICVVYFENSQGYVIVAPDRSHPTPQGFDRRECRTLREIDSLTRRLQSQDRNLFGRMFEQDRARMREKHAQIRAKLGQRLLAVDCSRQERLFILGMYRYMDRKEEEINRYHVGGYFIQREWDSKSACTDDYGKQIVMPKMSDRLASELTK